LISLIVDWDEVEIEKDEDKMWFDDWDDEEVADTDFVQRLRAELEKSAQSGSVN